MNHLTSKASGASRTRDDQWNNINDEMQARVSELLVRRVDPLIEAWALPRPAEFRVSVLWDLSMAGMEW